MTAASTTPRIKRITIKNGTLWISPVRVAQTPHKNKETVMSFLMLFFTAYIEPGIWKIQVCSESSPGAVKTRKFGEATISFSRWRDYKRYYVHAYLPRQPQ